MRQSNKYPYRYPLTNPPKALLNARLDNIAIVPASMLPLTETLREKVNTLPQGAVFLCYAEENTRQRQLLTFPLCCFDQIACWLPRNTP